MQFQIHLEYFPDHKHIQPLFFDLKIQLPIQTKLFHAKKEKHFVGKQ